MYENIFLTYNKDSIFGQNTALRLQTISNLYGLSVSLPSRIVNNGVEISNSTQERISNAAIIVAFGLENLTPLMESELAFAMLTNKPIVIINDKNIGQTIKIENSNNVHQVAVDFLDTDAALHDIVNFLERLPTKNKKEKNEIGLGSALIGIGLGLLALWALSRENE